MSDEQVQLYFRVLQQQMTASRLGDAAAWQEIEAVLEDLQLIYEQMQTTLEVAELSQAEIVEQTEQLAQRCDHYYDLFQSAPIAYLVTDAYGGILEANAAIAQLLHTPQSYLIGKPLVLYVAESDRQAFRNRWSQLLHASDPSRKTQIWQLNLASRPDLQPLPSEWHLAIVRDPRGVLESLRIGIYDLSRTESAIAHPAQLQSRQEIPALPPVLRLPQSLDGLRVLIVDDEADAREFLSAVLESSGIGVRAVDSAAAALKELEQFHPDVLVSDIRMPGGDGYRLIQQIRAWEAKQGWHIPAAAITAYLDEDRTKVLSAGFEAYLPKLAQPSELIKMVAQLAGRSLNATD